MTAIRDLADRYVERLAELDPVAATSMGVPGHDGEMPDLSPDGLAAREALDRETLEALAAAEPAGEPERVARAVMEERLGVATAIREAGEQLRPLRPFASPVQTTRSCFDLMPTATDADWETIAARMERVGEALRGLTATLQLGLARGLPASRRQALVTAKQAAVWSGVEGTSPFFTGLVREHLGDMTLHRRLEDAADSASAAYAELARYLREDYAPLAPERDPVGRERYELWVRNFLGTELDLEETYAWGWQELDRIEEEMDALAPRVAEGANLAAAVHILENDPSRAIEGVDAFQRWLQNLTDRTVADLNGRHFDIPEPLRRVECMIAPPGGMAAMYYTGPSEDFSRPGRTWYPARGRVMFPLWTEVSTAYHEGVPGHHLQVGLTRWYRERLSRFQRLATFVSGHGEGWALYAERLMAELGYLDDPGFRLGMLSAHAFRATRVILDIGLHLELPIPEGRDHAGETWTWDLALPFAVRHSWKDEDFMRSELERYLGMPAQAISYKVGEREWLAIRDEVRRRDGERFDLKGFHSHALELGPMGLAQLRKELTGR